jgi:hypothetical protein
VFQSDTFVFEVIGGRFTVSRALVARKSKTLEALMENGMKESQKGHGPLEDVDVPTFGRFSEFIYTGDYNPAQPGQPSLSISSTKRESPGDVEQTAESFEEPPAAPEPEEEQRTMVSWDVEPVTGPTVEPAEADTWPTSAIGKRIKKRKSRKHPSRADPSHATEELFGLASPNTLTSPTIEVVIAPPISVRSTFIPTGDWRLDYLPVFLSHAQLYVFADKYEVRDLQRLAARRLDETLGLFQFSSPYATDFAALLQYAYDNTAEREGKTDLLRTIVVNFIANNIESLIHSEIFMAMIENGGVIDNGGSLVRDVLRKTVCRL